MSAPQKNIPQSAIHALFYGIIFYVSYQLVAILSLAGFKFFGLNPVLGWVLSQVIGFSTVFTVSTKIMQKTWNQGRRPSGEVIALIDRIFEGAGLRRPELVILKPQNSKIQNAMVTGFLAGTGLFAPTLILTEDLPEVLSCAELHAVLAHEVIHLQRYHLAKRMMGIGASVICASVIIGGWILMGTALRLPGVVVNYFTFGGLVLWMGIHTVTHKRRVRAQEFEADLGAVTDLGADPQAVIEAVRTLSKLSGADEIEKAMQVAAGKRNRLEKFLIDWIYGSTHPLASERRAALAAAFPDVFADSTDSTEIQKVAA